MVKNSEFYIYWLIIYTFSKLQTHFGEAIENSENVSHNLLTKQEAYWHHNYIFYCRIWFFLLVWSTNYVVKLK